MKIVKRLLFLLGGSVLLLILAAALVWPFLRVDQRLRDLLVKEVSRAVAASVELQHVHLGVNYLDLYGLEITDRQDRWAVQLSQATVKFNPLNLLRYGFSVNGLLATISTIEINSPDVSLRLRETDSLTSAPDTTQFNGWKILDNLSDQFLINRVQLHTGLFHLNDTKGKPLLTLGGLNLELYSPRPGVFQGRLSSETLGQKPLQSKLDLSIDKRAKTLEVNYYAWLQHLAVGKQIGLPDSLSLRLDTAVVSLRLWALDTKTGLDGEISLNRLVLAHASQDLFTSDPVHLFIKDWRLDAPDLQGHGLSADWHLSGNVPDLRSSVVDLSVAAHSEDCSGLSLLLPKSVDLAPGGRLDLAASIKGLISRPQVNLKLDLGRLNNKFETIENIHLAGDYEDSRIIVNECTGHSAAGDLSLDGQLLLDGAKSLAQAQFNWQGTLPLVSGSRPGTLTGNISGENGILNLAATWLPTGARALTIQGIYAAASESLKVNLDLAESAAGVALTVTRLLDHPVVYLRFDNPQLLVQQILKWDQGDKLSEWRCTGDVAGPLDQLTCRLSLQQPKEASIVNLNGLLSIKSTQGADFNGDIFMQRGKGSPLEGHINAGWQDGIATLHSLELDHAITASGSLNTLTGEIGASELHLANWPLARGMAILFPQVAAQWGATLDARVEAFGTLQRPEITFNLYASQGFFLDQSNFWAVISADLHNDTLRLTDCNVGRGTISLVKANGFADLADSSLKFRVNSNLVDVATVLDLFGGNPALISGPLKLDADVIGSFKQPQLELHVGMAYGSVYHIPFDSLSASLRLDTATDQALVLNDFHLFQKPDLSLDVQGVLPYNDHPLDLQLLFKGNILKILHQIEPDILASRGTGELLVHLAQVNGKITLTSASLDLHDGYLKLPEVVNEISSIEAKIALQNNLFHIDNLSGIVEDQRFRFSNSFDDAKFGRYQHLYFSGLNVDMGIMILETFGRGLHAHIPELMPNGTKGYLNIRGKDGEHDFMVGGPVERPFFHGICNLAGAVVTFPFPPGNGKPPSAFVRQVLAVLNSARWDVVLEPARDNSYQHEIRPVDQNTLLGDVSNLIASVNIDLNIDATDSRLNVVGSLNQGDFAFIGNLVSTSGTLEYLDLNFRVERFETEFDQYSLLPWVSGRASTVYADSMGFSHNIYLKLYVVDHATGERRERGRWGDFVFILEDDAGSSQEQILAALGYSPGTVSSKVSALGGTILTGVVLRNFIHPVERQLEHFLQLDVFRLQPTIAQHIFESQILGTDPGPGPGPQSQIVWGAYFLRQSQLTVGKYLGDDVFLSYNGTLKTAISAANVRNFGFLHRWNLDYRIRPVSGNLVLTLGYEYDSLEKLTDKKISLRYSFGFR